MSSAFDSVSYALEVLKERADGSHEVELLRAISDCVNYWHDANHEVNDLCNRRTSPDARNRVDEWTIKLRDWQGDE